MSIFLQNKQEHLKLVNILTQETRAKIIRELLTAESPIYITELAQKIGTTARNTSFHLAFMETHALVIGQYAGVDASENNNSSGRAAKFYRLTEQGKDLATKLQIPI